MATPTDVQYLVEAVSPLCGPLHDAFEAAADTAQAYFLEHDMIDGQYGRERTDLTRAHGRKALVNADLGDWAVATNKRNGQILMRRRLLTAKVLHVAPGNMPPAPGRNRSRISYYTNPVVDLFGVATSRLILSWSVDPTTGEIEVRVLRPTGRWVYGAKAKTDVEFVLPRASADLMDLAFTPDDASIKLPFDFDGEEQGDGAANGW